MSSIVVDPESNEMNTDEMQVGEMSTASRGDEKRFVCNVCNKSFLQSFKLKQHVRTHTGEKPFECSECYFKFATSGGLNRHMKTHTGEKSFHCSQCDSTFATHESLKRHILTHTGEKSFPCGQCDKMFSRKSTLEKTHGQPHQRKTVCLHRLWRQFWTER